MGRRSHVRAPWHEPTFLIQHKVDKEMKMAMWTDTDEPTVDQYRPFNAGREE